MLLHAFVENSLRLQFQIYRSCCANGSNNVCCRVSNTVLKYSEWSSISLQIIKRKSPIPPRTIYFCTGHCVYENVGVPACLVLFLLGKNFLFFNKISIYGQRETHNLQSSILQQSHILLQKLKTVILCKHEKPFNNACDRDVSSIAAVPNFLS